ncbi:DEAD/DEAH box helicase [Streptomyces griseorubiginosus]|uniref:DEAD/DEAH box helicase n=1 Tax=Streptomyces griseorubiginosus TaxID=67304 RepID=UPI001AD6E23C|nr:DEAD/DEAH box helicase [Streptomyces griseorubiginosus]MBO4260507.1 ATP-dependent helicase [Streptomyces griseorubiginosus]
MVDVGEARTAPVGLRAREVCARGTRLYDAARTVLEDHARALEAVRSALAPLRDELVAKELESIPVARLKDATEGRLRLAAVEAAGFTTVRSVYEAGRFQLRQIPGVGAQTADQALAAAGQIARAVEETVSVRIDVDHPEPRTTALVVALHRLVEAGPELRRAVDIAEGLDRALRELLPAARPATGRLRLALAGHRRKEAALAATARLSELVADADAKGTPLQLAQASTDLLRGPASDIEAWVDFELRSAEYYSQLAEVSEHRTDEAAAEGFLPSEVARRVHAQSLDDTHRRVSLRGYQSFGARFALAQRRVVLGDEMGLGKTVQAIAALAHLAAQGQTHFLVVSPASVLINWTREIRSRSTLRAVPVHGPDRQDAYAEWRERGGVALTTFDLLHTLPAPERAARGGTARDGGVPGMLVVDEAHYVKNPDTRRARSIAAWTRACDRVLFLTGTPMENRVEEFRTLVRYLQPDLVPEIHDSHAVAGPHVFRRSVAPAYLRRNQQDVLTELPALLHTDEWEEFSAADQDAYRTAVAEGNFMAMRRAAYADPEKSAKLQRLGELVAEAEANGLKVVVFSYFRDVLAAVRQALGEGTFGPISGGVPAARRQRLVDDFTAADGHAVLLAQIEAGGVGLNLQAASVVVLCEPQVKPTLEHQAVARAHRMGQVRPVQVHRLLATDSVDERLLRILENKDRLFDAYTRRSDTADATPDAVDISDATIARRIVEEEQRRLAVGKAD